MAIDPKQDDVGRTVVYRNARHAMPESGVITFVPFPPNGGVFVRYVGDNNSKYTYNGDLNWEFPE